MEKKIKANTILYAIAIAAQVVAICVAFVARHPVIAMAVLTVSLMAGIAAGALDKPALWINALMLAASVACLAYTIGTCLVVGLADVAGRLLFSVISVILSGVMFSEARKQ